MLSKTIAHIEAYNKNFNIAKYCEVLKEKNYDVENESNEFYKQILKATIMSNSQARKNVDIDKHYEKFVKNNEEYKLELARNYFVFYIMACWLDYKQIYRFDSETLKMIYDSPYKDMGYKEIDALAMPYECFAIENELELEGVAFDTILINRKHTSNGNIILSIYPFVKSEDVKVSRYDIIAEPQRTLFSQLEDKISADEVRFLKGVMNLILYLCQPKVDIRRKKSENKPNKDNKIPKCMYAVSYDENEVGYKLGSAIRNYRYVYEKGDSLSIPSDKKRIVKPHARCGHFHHYWTGKGRTDLIVKYVEPTFVLGGNRLATMHKVK